MKFIIVTNNFRHFLFQKNVENSQFYVELWKIPESQRRQLPRFYVTCSVLAFYVFST